MGSGDFEKKMEDIILYGRSISVRNLKRLKIKRTYDGICPYNIEVLKGNKMNESDYYSIDYQISVMHAAKEGKTIQSKNYFNWQWSDVKNPQWNWGDTSYRIKPEEKEKKLTKECFDGMHVVWIQHPRHKRSYCQLIVEFDENDVVFRDGCLCDYTELLDFNYSVDRKFWKPCKELAR